MGLQILVVVRGRRGYPYDPGYSGLEREGDLTTIEEKERIEDASGPTSSKILVLHPWNKLRPMGAVDRGEGM